MQASQRTRRLLLPVLISGCLLAPHPASGEDFSIENLALANIEELLNTPVTSVSRTEGTVKDSPAAVTVLTNDQIRRSGVTSIPEALRLIPGVQVARVDANKWAVSIRGFNNRLSNKLLVLIDGRSIYDQFFAGVLWETKDIMLEDVERIEVVRGPGGSTWGNNAVNGVINILTKKARDTQGGLVTGGGGTEEQGFGSLRYGFAAGESGHGRIYAKYYNRSSGFRTTQDVDDTSEAGQAGFRSDWGSEDSDFVTLQGDTYVGKLISLEDVPIGRGDTDGTNFLARWMHRHSEDSQTTLQFYYDYNDIGSELISEARNTFDLLLKNESKLSEDNFLVVGVEANHTRDSLKLIAPFGIDPKERSDEIYAFFAEDRQKLSEDVTFFAGVRLDHNDYTDGEAQPTARLIWDVDDKNTLWTAFSRAVRVPSRIESDQFLEFVPGIRATGNKNLDTEKLFAYEIGSRHVVSDGLFIELATYIYDYDDLVSLEGLTLGNGGKAVNYGGELAVTYTPYKWWRLNAGYALLKMNLGLQPGSVADGPSFTEPTEGASPVNQAFFVSQIDLSSSWEWDFDVRYVDSLPGTGVKSYVVADTRIAYRINPSLELAVVGQNLFQAHHYEQHDLISTEVEQSVYGKLTWSFR